VVDEADLPELADALGGTLPAALRAAQSSTTRAPLT
jgi:hypothetical protein